MTAITLTPEQSEQAAAVARVIVLDASANMYGHLVRLNEADFSPEEIAEAKRRARSPGPWYTTQQVLDHLQALEVADSSTLRK